MADDDCFCTRCGTPVRRPAEEQAPARPSAAAYNPEFTWNVQEFPAEPRKTADIDFQWGPAQGAQGRRAYVVDERRPLFFSTGESYGAPEEPRPRPAYADPLAGENPWQQKGLYQTSPETQTFRRSKVQTMEIPAAKPEEPAAPAADEPITGHRLEEELFREMEESTRQARERHEEKILYLQQEKRGIPASFRPGIRKDPPQRHPRRASRELLLSGRRSHPRFPAGRLRARKRTGRARQAGTQVR